MAIILAVIAVVVIGIVVVAAVVIARRVQDQGISFDIGESGGLTIGEDAGYGDDPELDALWDDCADEDWDACDQLYFQASFLSEYETFGETCGERREEGGDLCVDHFGDGTSAGGSSTGGSGETYGDDPELDALWDDCEAGDMAACDRLYLTSPVDTEYEEFGRTCGQAREPDGGICDTSG